MVLYKIIQKILRIQINLALSCFSWASKREKAVKKRKRV